MGNFVDANGGQWSLDIDYEAVKRVKQSVGVDLLKPLPRDGDDEENPLLTQLDFDPVLMVDVVHAIIKPQMDEKGIDMEALVKAFPVSKHPELADAFWGAYIDFFQSLGWAQVVKAIEKQRSVTKKLVQKTADMIDKAAELTLEGIDVKMEKVLQDIEADIETDKKAIAK